MPDGSRGDLYITINVKPDNIFARDGDNLLLTAGIDVLTLLTGGSIQLPTLNGNVRTNIKAGTPPDSKLRLKGKGFPLYKKEGQCGDLIVTLKAIMPTLNEKQKQLLEQAKSLSDK